VLGVVGKELTGRGLGRIIPQHLMSLLLRRAQAEYPAAARQAWDSVPVPNDAAEGKAARKRTGRIAEIAETLGIWRRVVKMSCDALEQSQSRKVARDYRYNFTPPAQTFH